MSLVSTFLLFYPSFASPSDIFLTLLLFVAISSECCRYFLAHVACRNLPWQGLISDYNFVILSPYSYLHGCETPIVHGNLMCDTIFIQHNGLIKIGSGNDGYIWYTFRSLGGSLVSIFAEYVPPASQNPYPIIVFLVYFVANYRQGSLLCKCVVPYNIHTPPTITFL